MIYNQYPCNIYNPNYLNPDYLRQLEAMAACLAEIARQAEVDRQRNGGGF